MKKKLVVLFMVFALVLSMMSILAVQAAEENLADDGELVAVIAAAIAAAEGTSTDGFVVRSIKRRKSNRWN